MKKQVWLKIEGTQSCDGQTDKTEVITQGMYYKRNDMYYITYKETEATGFEGCTSIIKVKPDKITFIRQGNSNTNMVIENRQRNIGCYSTQLGDLMVGTTAKEINIALDDDGGSVSFEYALDINYQYISDNSINIQVLTDNHHIQV